MATESTATKSFEARVYEAYSVPELLALRHGEYFRMPEEPGERVSAVARIRALTKVLKERGAE